MPPLPPARPTGQNFPSPPEEIVDLTDEILIEEETDSLAYDARGAVEERGGGAPQRQIDPVSHPSDDAPILLVIDDDPSMRSLVAAGLGMRYTIYEACDGEDALSVLEHIPHPDAIVCDVMMPRMDGLTFARTMKNRKDSKSIPIIFLTAKDKPMDVVQGINAGARHYLSKPFKLKDLADKVDAIAGRSPRSTKF